MTETKQRLRLTFAKTETVKYIGHLDLMLAWERSLRRARLPLSYSQGFNPRPKMQAAASLPLGSTGTAELLDIVLDEPVDIPATQSQIIAALPVGIQLHAIEELPLKSSTMQQLVRQAEYRVTIETDISAEVLEQRIATLLAQTEIWQTRTRRKKEERFNLRPLVYELKLLTIEAGDAIFLMNLATGQHGNLRPESVLEALDLADNWFSIERGALFLAEENEKSLHIPSES